MSLNADESNNSNLVIDDDVPELVDTQDVDTILQKRKKDQYNADLKLYKQFLADNPTDLTDFPLFYCSLEGERLTQKTGLQRLVDLRSNGKSTIDSLIESFYSEEEAFKIKRSRLENIPFMQ